MKSLKLTGGERLLIERRRGDPSVSQRDAAKNHDVSLRRYRRWEDDKESVPEEQLDPAFPLLDPHEDCFIRRRRAGLSLQDLADTLRISRWWLCQMEHDRVGISKLVAYWTRRSDHKPWRRPLKQSVR